MADCVLTLTILDLPEVLEIVHEALDAVPDWERKALQERLEAILARAHEAKRKR